MYNFYEHCQALMNFERLVHNLVKGQFRQKKRKDPETNFVLTPK